MTTIEVWQCVTCAEYNLLSMKECAHCHNAQSSVSRLAQIATSSPAALELLGSTIEAPQIVAKQAKSAKKGKTKRQPMDKLYKRVIWGEFDRILQFAVGGEPIAKERPRLGKGGNTFTPKKTKNYEGDIRSAAKTAMQDTTPLDGLLQLEITIYRSNGVRADIDNVLKSILDGMNGVIYYDDSQVAELKNVRIIRYAKQTGISVTIRQFKQSQQKKGKAA